MTVGDLISKLAGPEYVGTTPVYVVNDLGDLTEIVQVSWVAATETHPELIVIEGGEAP